jgi:hypothetical protein
MPLFDMSYSQSPDSTTTIKPDPSITVPGAMQALTNEVNPGTIVSLAGRFGLSNSKLTFEVLENGEWVQVESATEVGNGSLRYVKDGYGKSAIAGNWRVRMDEQYAELEQQVTAKGKSYAIWAILAFVGILILVLAS